jgi:aerobic C4-dicarboxylate transport protein
VAPVVIAAWEGDIDRAQARRVLDGEAATDTAVILDAPLPHPQSA